MAKHGVGAGAHAPRGRAARRRRRRRATRLATTGGTALTLALLLAFGPGLGVPGGSDRADVETAIVAQDLPVADEPAVVQSTVAKPPARAKPPVLARPPVRLPAAEAPADPPGVRARSGRASRPTVPTSASGRYEVVPGRDGAAGRGKVVRYMVEVEKGLPFDVDEFAADVHRILNHSAGWGHGGSRLRFVRVDSGKARFRVALSSPALTDAQCAPLRTYGKVSCFNGRRSVINAERWAHGAPTYPHDLSGYRNYVISHEVGHALGKDHVGCPRRGARAPVMVQQTKSLEGCTANPWPFPEDADGD